MLEPRALRFITPITGAKLIHRAGAGSGCPRNGKEQVMSMRLIPRAFNLAGLVFVVICVTQSAGADDPPKQSPGNTISTSVAVVVAPTTVRAKSGKYIQDLQLSDFEVYDNGKLQKVTADLRDSPFSLVVAIQRSADMTGILPKVRGIGLALTDLVVGQDGEIAVIGFDHSVQIRQDFTSDGDKVDQAVRDMKTGSYSHAAIDAVMASVRMLQNRPRDRRRGILVISEKWDKGSHASLHEALIEAQLANVTIYSLTVSTAAAELTSEPKPQPPPILPTTAYHVPAGAPLTPTTIEDNYYLGNWVPLVVNGFQSVKNVFADNTIEALTRYTGGEKYSFSGDGSLDKAIQSLSQDLHSEYLLSYSPNNLNVAGFHKIRVVVKGQKLAVRTRPGYWIVDKPE
jgi:VWFA-related protein